MKPIVLVAFAPLALAACGPFGTGGSATTGNTSLAAAPVTPDAVIVNGVTYVRAGGPATAGVPVPAATAPPSTAPVAVATPAAPIADDSSSTPPPSGDQPDGVTVTGGH